MKAQANLYALRLGKQDTNTNFLFYFQSYLSIWLVSVPFYAVVADCDWEKPGLTS